MGISKIIVILVLLSLSGQATAAALMTVGKYSKLQLEQQFEVEGSCDGCMATNFPGAINIFETGGNAWCNGINPYLTGPAYRVWSHVSGSEWVGFTLLLVAREALDQAVTLCEQSWLDNYWGTIEDENNETYEVRGAYMVGYETSFGSLENAIDPQRGQPEFGDLPNYNFAINFDPLVDILQDFQYYDQHGWYGAATPWEKVTAAAAFWYSETQDECARWSLAHALVCYQSCNPGWDCGRSEMDLLPPGFPEWEFNWQEQPTFLFYLYDATAPYVEQLTVPTNVKKWDNVKAMYR